MEKNDTDDVYDAVMECFKVLGQPLSVYSDDEGALNSKKLQAYFEGEGIEHIITKTHANQAERMIRTIKKMIADRLRANKDKTWVDMLKPSLNRYNTQVHSSTKMSPSKAHDLNNALREIMLVFNKGKGNYTSRKETKSQWTDRKYKVIHKGRGMLNFTYNKLDGLSKKKQPA